MRGGIHFTDHLPSNDMRDTYNRETDGRDYEAHHSGGLKCHDTDTKIHTDWFSNSKVNEGDSDTRTA
jgi:predicted 2-oxoglutarate/Fe(II)-dependent dioxygenase YbiX